MMVSLGTFDDSYSCLSSAAKTLLSSHGIEDSATDFTEQYPQPIVYLIALLTDLRFQEFYQLPRRLLTSSTGDQGIIGLVHQE
jgi:hypothetical protein